MVMPQVLRKVRVGCNVRTWSAELQCRGNEDGLGCGAILEVPRDALFTVDIPMMRTPRTEVCFWCADCNADTAIADGHLFKGLPTREEWFAEHRPPEWFAKHRPSQGFIIKLDGDGYYCTPGSRGWSHDTRIKNAHVFATYELAQEVIDTVPMVKNYHPKIILRPTNEEFVIELDGRYYTTDDALWSALDPKIEDATVFPTKEAAEATIRMESNMFEGKNPNILPKPTVD